MAAVKNLFSYTEKILHLDNTNYAKIVHNKVAGKPKLKGKLITNEHIRRCVNETPCSKVFYGYFATNIFNFAGFFSLSIQHFLLLLDKYQYFDLSNSLSHSGAMPRRYHRQTNNTHPSVKNLSLNHGSATRKLGLLSKLLKFCFIFCFIFLCQKNVDLPPNRYKADDYNAY